MSDEKPPQHGQLRTYGRVGAKDLSARQRKLVADLLPRLSVPECAPGTLDPASVFACPPRETWFEIGFGGGEHLTGQAQRHPDIGIIGVEPYVEGVAKALALAEDMSLANARIHMGDAREVIDRFRPASLDRVFILFPDPWPKYRHWKRRILQDAFVGTLARVVKQGGSVRFATDWAHYADWALERFLRSPDFAWTASRADDWRIPPQDHVTTRYQTKNMGDCKPVFLDFRRL